MSRKELEQLLAKARRSVKAAERLLQAGDYGFAEIGREQAEAGIEAARQFVDEMGRRLESEQR